MSPYDSEYVHTIIKDPPKLASGLGTRSSLFLIGSQIQSLRLSHVWPRDQFRM